MYDQLQGIGVVFSRLYKYFYYVSPKMPPRFSFNIDLTSNVNVTLNLISFAAMVQMLQIDKCVHCFIKSFWMIITKVEWTAP
jgi:hypothetical protein